MMHASALLAEDHRASARRTSRRLPLAHISAAPHTYLARTPSTRGGVAAHGGSVLQRVCGTVPTSCTRSLFFLAALVPQQRAAQVVKYFEGDTDEEEYLSAEITVLQTISVLDGTADLFAQYHGSFRTPSDETDRARSDTSRALCASAALPWRAAHLPCPGAHAWSHRRCQGAGLWRGPQKPGADAWRRARASLQLTRDLDCHGAVHRELALRLPDARAPRGAGSGSGFARLRAGAAHL